MANISEKFSPRLKIYRLNAAPSSTAGDDPDREIDARTAFRLRKQLLDILDRIDVVFSDPIDNQSALESGLVGRAFRFDRADQNTFSARQAEGIGEVLGQVLQLQSEQAVRVSGAGDPTRDMRLAAFEWFRPSIVYYSGREVKLLESPDAVAA